MIFEEYHIQNFGRAKTLNLQIYKEQLQTFRFFVISFALFSPHLFELFSIYFIAAIDVKNEQTQPRMHENKMCAHKFAACF